MLPQSSSTPNLRGQRRQRNRDKGSRHFIEELKGDNGKQAVSRGANIAILLGNYQLQMCGAALFGQPAQLLTVVAELNVYSDY